MALCRWQTRGCLFLTNLRLVFVAESQAIGAGKNLKRYNVVEEATSTSQNFKKYNVVEEATSSSQNRYGVLTVLELQM